MLWAFSDLGALRRTSVGKGRYAYFRVTHFRHDLAPVAAGSDDEELRPTSSGTK
jgi:hypothetical protein